MIGNQAVQRLMNRATSAPAIQRLRTINEDVIVNGELAVGKSLSAQNLMTSGGVIGNNAFFNEEVAGSKFTAHGLRGAGVRGTETEGTEGETAPTPSEPTGGGTDLSEFGLGSP